MSNKLTSQEIENMKKSIKDMQKFFDLNRRLPTAQENKTVLATYPSAIAKLKELLRQNEAE